MFHGAKYTHSHFHDNHKTTCYNKNSKHWGKMWYIHIYIYIKAPTDIKAAHITSKLPLFEVYLIKINMSSYSKRHQVGSFVIFWYFSRPNGLHTSKIISVDIHLSMFVWYKYIKCRFSRAFDRLILESCKVAKWLYSHNCFSRDIIVTAEYFSRDVIVTAEC